MAGASHGRGVALVAVCLLALGAGGCGASDEEQIRDAVADLSRAVDKKDAGRACEVLSFRAEAQFAGFASVFSGATTCEEVMKAGEPDDEQRLTPKAIEQAKVTIRDDLALLRARKDEGAVGLRNIDGEWRVDNILNPSLREEVRGDPRLARGTHEQQIRATMLATADAFAREDHARACRLMSYTVEAQLYIAAAFASLAVADSDASTFSCPQALRRLTSLADRDKRAGSLAADLPSRAQLLRARISIRGTRATVRAAGAENEPCGSTAAGCSTASPRSARRPPSTSGAGVTPVRSSRRARRTSASPTRPA